MTIEQISKNEFDGLQPARGQMASVLADEKAWYADSERRIIGTILFDKTDQDWNFVVLGPDESGKFRWIAGESSFATKDEAARRLTEKMEDIIASGEIMFPQD